MAEIESLPAKTARFSRIVEQAGHPEPYTLWQDPAKDPEFQKALRADRVMTVIRQPASSKSDVAVVGFLNRPGALFLLFPQSLKPFEDHKIIGLKYDLLTQPKPKGKLIKPEDIKPPRPRPIVPPAPAPEPSRKTHPSRTAPSHTAVAAHPAAPAKSEKKPKPSPRFVVTVTLTSTVEKSIEVEAKNKQAAKKLSLAQIEASPADFTAGAKTAKVKTISQVKAGADSSKP